MIGEQKLLALEKTKIVRHVQSNLSDKATGWTLKAYSNEIGSLHLSETIHATIGLKYVLVSSSRKYPNLNLKRLADLCNSQLTKTIEKPTLDTSSAALFSIYRFKIKITFRILEDCMDPAFAYKARNNDEVIIIVQDPSPTPLKPGERNQPKLPRSCQFIR